MQYAFSTKRNALHLIAQSSLCLSSEPSVKLDHVLRLRVSPPEELEESPRAVEVSGVDRELRGEADGLLGGPRGFRFGALRLVQFRRLRDVGFRRVRGLGRAGDRPGFFGRSCAFGRGREGGRRRRCAAFSSPVRPADTTTT